MYCWDCLDYFKNFYEIVKNEGFFIGMKLVCGVYMEKENKRVEEKNYVLLICVFKEVIDENYDVVVYYMLEYLDMMLIFVGIYNELSFYKLMEMMEEKGIVKNNNKIWFG